MPRATRRKALLNRLEDLSVAAVRHGRRLKVLGLSTCRVEDLLRRFQDLQQRVKSRRYLSRGSYKKRTAKFELFLDSTSDDSLSEKEFKFHFRVSRETFNDLAELLKGHPAFQRKSSDSRGPLPKPASHQLLVLMKHCGCEGNSACSISLGHFFGIAAGAVDGCRNNALSALLSLEDQTYFWPDAEERSRIATRIKGLCLFPHCVGLIDGTLLPLAYRPLPHGENYLSRKRFYAIVMLVVCDDLCRVLRYHIGWPGSVHDNRVWRNCRLHRRCQSMFSNKECLLGDSAFAASSIMIPPFKNVPGNTLSSNKTAFNTLLAKPRVKSEHCIGILQGRFPFLKCTRLKLGNKMHMRRIIDCVRGCVTLHNHLIGEPIEEQWLEGAEQEGLDDLDPEPCSSDANDPDHCRRNELFHYLSELEETTTN